MPIAHGLRVRLVLAMRILFLGVAFFFLVKRVIVAVRVGIEGKGVGPERGRPWHRDASV